MSASRLDQHYGGWRPSLPDQRDLIADASEIRILPEVDPRDELPAIYDQRQLGSCTANAVAAAIDYDRIVSGAEPYGPSRLALYYFARLLERAPLNQDTGAYGRDGFRAARHFGICPEDLWPYSDDTNPTTGSFDDDPRRHVPKPEFVKLDHPYKVVRRTEDGFRAVLSNRQTIAFGLSIYESFESAAVEHTGVVPVPQRGEKLLGGHEMLAVGYLHAEPHYALVRNSWGSDWGIGGYCLIPWSYLLDPNLGGDFRTIYRPLGA